MQIKRNVAIAAALSALLHLLVLYGIGAGLRAPRESLDLGAAPPIQMRFVPPPEQEPPRRRQLIETIAPTEAEPDQAEYIAETNALAADIEPSAGEQKGPASIEEADFDQLRVPKPQDAPTPPAPPPSPASAPTAPSPPEQEPIKEVAKEPVQMEKLARLDTPPPAQPIPETLASIPSPPQPQARNAVEPAPKLPEGRTMGKHRGGVDAIGFVGFEAMEDEIAPYLREIQDAVELRWREMLLTRYSGVSPTLAEIDCEIGQDGSIVRLEVVGTPPDPVYAALCRFAINKAGPFKPFPFAVPPEYANRNLEIRWTFNFLTR